jgi:hypothetical protein
MLALAFVVVLGLSGLADAKVKGGKGGMKGKIVSVTGNTFTMSMGKHGKKNAAAADAGKTMTVKFDATTLINGVAGGKIDASMVGKKVTVVGGNTGDSITATSVTITDHKKKKNA